MAQFTRLSGWANFPQLLCRVLRAEQLESVHTETNLIARGNGRAFGDSALNPNATLLMGDRNQILGFSKASITCESGLLLSDLLKACVPRGLFPAVTPGTKFVTVGGMIASDVHGKNHGSHGSFCRHVVEIQLQLANGETVRCSAQKNSELFRATCGGMGLTGIILAATIELMSIETTWVRQEVIRCSGLQEVLEVLEKSQHFTYMAAWFDGLSKGKGRGQSIVYRGNHASLSDLPASFKKAPLLPPVRTVWSTPFHFPRNTLNKFTMGLFNRFYLRRKSEDWVNYDSFLYPLDAVLEWNKFYGVSGFAQHQCVIPFESATRAFDEILEKVELSRFNPYLAVIKRFGAQSTGLLSFPMEGYTLVLDFPMRPGLIDLFAELNDIVEKYGGRIYLSKDSLMSASHFQKTYPRLEEFKRIRKQYGAEGYFTSAQSKRIGLDL